MMGGVKGWFDTSGRGKSPQSGLRDSGGIGEEDPEAAKGLLAARLDSRPPPPSHFGHRGGIPSREALAEGVGGADEAHVLGGSGGEGRGAVRPPAEHLPAELAAGGGEDGMEPRGQGGKGT